VVVFGIVGVVPNGAERFLRQTRGSLGEMPVLIPNRQEVNEVFNLRNPVGRKASNLLDQRFVLGARENWTTSTLEK
jgi:hypothetical protein